MIKIYAWGQVSREQIFARGTAAADVSGKVAEIIARVRQQGDEALLAYAREFDKAELTSLEVSQAEIDAAFASVEPRFLAVLNKAAANIRAYHEKQLRQAYRDTNDFFVDPVDLICGTERREFLGLNAWLELGKKYNAEIQTASKTKALG